MKNENVITHLAQTSCVVATVDHQNAIEMYQGQVNSANSASSVTAQHTDNLAYDNLKCVWTSNFKNSKYIN